jgi:hypothetical protein
MSNSDGDMSPFDRKINTSGSSPKMPISRSGLGLNQNAINPAATGPIKSNRVGFFDTLLGSKRKDFTHKKEEKISEKEKNSESSDSKKDPLFTQSKSFAKQKEMAGRIIGDEKMARGLGLHLMSRDNKFRTVKGITGGFHGLGKKETVEKAGDAILRRDREALKKIFPEATANRLINNSQARKDVLRGLGGMTSSFKGKEYLRRSK